MALHRQGRYEEALAVFEEAIERGNDGKYPLRNKAKALEKLGRLEEAIETLRLDVYRGELTKSAEWEVARLEAIKSSPEQPGTLYVETPEEEEDEVLGEDEAPLPAEGIVGRAESSPVPKERWLETMLEQKIDRDSTVFGRRLKMYETVEGYGRQFAIPEVGRIDLLVEDPDTNTLIVVELKKGASDDQVIGQISRYMTWVRDHLAQDGQEVQGIVCVRHATNNLLLSAKNVTGLEVFEYGLTLQQVA